MNSIEDFNYVFGGFFEILKDDEEVEFSYSSRNSRTAAGISSDGKTLTIAAKVKYLCEVKNINPDEILLVSFTKKSAQEMTERIQEKLGINAQATTFHRLGLEIIKNANGRKEQQS